MRGLELDSLAGHANFSDVHVQYKDQSLALDQISIDAKRDQQFRSIVVNSNLVDAEVKGDYSLNNLSNDLEVLAK
jgi:hypothetical protein